MYFLSPILFSDTLLFTNSACSYFAGKEVAGLA